MIKATMKDKCISNYSDMLESIQVINHYHEYEIDVKYRRLYEKYNKILPIKDMSEYLYVLSELHILKDCTTNGYYIKYYCE